jgi:hypothetical protein
MQTFAQRKAAHALKADYANRLPVAKRIALARLAGGAP